MDDLTYPRELTPDLSEILGMMVFNSGPIAHAFRDAGRADIKRKCEAEQAFVLHWLLTLCLEHGALWRRHAGETLQEVIKEAEAARAAKAAQEGRR